MRKERWGSRVSLEGHAISGFLLGMRIGMFLEGLIFQVMDCGQCYSLQEQPCSL